MQSLYFCVKSIASDMLPDSLHVEWELLTVCVLATQKNPFSVFSSLNNLRFKTKTNSDLTSLQWGKYVWNEIKLQGPAPVFD